MAVCGTYSARNSFAVEYRKITSSQDWRELWLGKFTAELENRSLPPKETKSFCAVLVKYLTAYEGNPRDIDIEKTRQFVLTGTKDVIAPLALFYEAVARSEKHLALLAELAAQKPKAPQKKS